MQCSVLFAFLPIVLATGVVVKVSNDTSGPMFMPSVINVEVGGKFTLLFDNGTYRIKPSTPENPCKKKARGLIFDALITPNCVSTKTGFGERGIINDYMALIYTVTDKAPMTLFEELRGHCTKGGSAILQINPSDGKNASNI